MGAQLVHCSRCHTHCSPLPLPPHRIWFPSQARRKQTPYHAMKPCCPDPVPAPAAISLELIAGWAALLTLARLQRRQLTEQQQRKAQRPELLLKTEGLSVPRNLHNLAFQHVNFVHYSPLGTGACIDQSRLWLLRLAPGRKKLCLWFLHIEEISLCKEFILITTVHSQKQHEHLSKALNRQTEAIN